MINLQARKVLLLPLLALLCYAFAARGQQSSRPQLELLPQHFQLRPGERIHYNTVQRASDGKLMSQSQARFPDPVFSVEDPSILKIVDPGGMFEALKPGRTDIILSIPNTQRRITVTVSGSAQRPINAVAIDAISHLQAKEFLFVGHANRDGFDYTAVAKPGIDRLIKQAKQNGVPVVYFVSAQYPDWYTEDRQPDYAIVTEGQEHEVRVDADRVIFTGGDFMFCTLRNVQMTLHTMLKENPPQNVHFVFPADALWYEDVWSGTEKRWYPAPMLTLATIFARHRTDELRYANVVVPFLERTINEFPVLNYPRPAPVPPLRELLKDWTIVVRFGQRFEKIYQQATSRTLVLEFQEM